MVPTDLNIVTQTGSENNILVEQQTGTVLHDSQAPIIPEASGALIPIENISDTGLLKIGDENAPITLLVFTEYHCGYCHEFQTEQIPMLITDYVLTGEMQIHIGIFTLDKYPNSLDAAKGMYCAAIQGKGFKMNTLLFEKNNKAKVSLLSYAKDLGMDEEAFGECMENENTEKIILSQKEWAQSMGVKYVPTFFLNGEKLVGLQYMADLKGRIDDMIEERK